MILREHLIDVAGLDTLSSNLTNLAVIYLDSNFAMKLQFTCIWEFSSN